jgi:hypothetical protein
MAQGPTRQARGQAYARYVNEKLGGHHQVVVVTGCGHNGRCIYTSGEARPFLFPQAGPGRSKGPAVLHHLRGVSPSLLRLVGHEKSLGEPLAEGRVTRCSVDAAA